MRFRASGRSSKEAKIHAKSNSEDDRIKKSKTANFLHPSLVKSLLLGSNGGQEGVQMGARINFETLIRAMSAFDPDNKESGLLWGGGGGPGGGRRHGIGRRQNQYFAPDVDRGAQN